MKIADNIEMLEIPGNNGALHPVLIWDNDDVILIDTGLPGQIELLRAAVERAGFPLSRITKVILTHQDMDHIGCAKELSQGGAEIMAHEDEAAYIQGDKTPVKIAAMEARLDELTDGEREFYDRLKANAPRIFTHVGRRLKDGEVLPFCGGIEIIHTPGHSPGHIALLLKESKIIIAGDAANIANGKITGANPQFTQDMPLSEISLEKLKGFYEGEIICYHGGYLSGC